MKKIVFFVLTPFIFIFTFLFNPVLADENLEGQELIIQSNIVEVDFFDEDSLLLKKENPSSLEISRKIQTEDFILYPAGGKFRTGIEIILEKKSPNKKLFWSFQDENPGNIFLLEPETRINIFRSRKLYIWSFGVLKNEYRVLDSFEYQIESLKENDFFRIFSLDAHPNKDFVSTVTLENASEFSMSMAGWKIISGEVEVSLPNEEIFSGEKRRFVVPLSYQGGEVFLQSPTHRTKDEVSYPYLLQNQVFQRIESFIPKNIFEKRRPPFTVIEKPE